ncbi:MAG: DUF456 domain-containing protein [Desulfatiglandales bacterium]
MLPFCELPVFMDTFFTISLISLGFILAVAGFLGCLIPMLPGPPLTFGALILLSFAKGWEPFSLTFLLVMAGLVVLAALLDYVVPAAGAKKYGASRLGIWGSAAGLILGLVFFPPFGMFLGGMAGAVLGELLAGRRGGEAFRAGWGVFLGSMVSTGFRMSLSAVMIFFYIKEMF